MINPFRALGSSLRDLFDDFLLLIICNLLWALLSLPLWLLAYVLLGAGQPIAAAATAMIGVLPAGPATAGLFFVAHRVTEGLASKLGAFFTGVRRHARLGIILTGIGMGGLLVILFNLGFYLNVTNLFGGIMLGLWLYLLIFWLGLQIYVFPLAFLQEQPDLRTIARNAFLMAVGRPIFTILTLLLMGAFFLLSSFLIAPLVLFSTAFLTVWATRATRTLIDEARRRREAADGTAPPAPDEERGRRGQVRPK
jgi:uncharacterized membrane protein YesL